MVPQVNPLLEREQMLSSFAGAVETALVAGEGSLVLVRGAPGTGRSRLLGELRSVASQRGMVVLSARGSVVEQDLPLGVVDQLLGTLDSPPGDTELGALNSGANGADVPAPVLAAILARLNEAARAAPLLLAVDDLVLADAPSQRALAFLAHRVRAQRIVIACTGPIDVAGVPSVAAAILDDPDALVLRTRPLSAQAVRTLAGAHLGRDAEAAFAETVHDLTNGIARAVVALLDRADVEGLAPTAGDAEGLAALVAPAAAAAAPPSATAGSPLERARSAWLGGDVGAAALVLTRAESALPADRPDERFAVEAELQILGRLALHVRTRDVQRLRDLARELPRDDPSVRSALVLSALDGALRGEPAEGVATLADIAWAGGRLLGEAGVRSPAVHAVAGVLVLAEKDEAAHSALSAIIGAARQDGLPGPEAMALTMRARMAVLRGDPISADRDAAAACALTRQPGAALMAAAAAAWLALARGVGLGRRAEGEAIVAQALAVAPPGGSPVTETLLLARGILALEAGRPADAVDDLLECGRIQQTRGISNPGALRWRAPAARALAALGHPRRARDLVDAEVAIARRFGAPRSLSVALENAGAVAGGADGIELLREAAELAGAVRTPGAQARTLVELGAALRRGGHRVEARERLTNARVLAETAGLEHLLARATEELIAAGARPRRAHAAGPASLTNRERRVAELAARGATNREVAAELYVTVKTVEMHLSHAFRKLGVASRTQLRAALVEPAGREDLSA